MSELFLFIDNFIKNYINEVALFLISMLLSSILFVMWIFILRLSTNFIFIKKLNFLLIELSLFIMQISINIIANKPIGYAMLYLSVACTYSAIIFSINKGKKPNKKQSFRCAFRRSLFFARSSGSAKPRFYNRTYKRRLCKTNRFIRRTYCKMVLCAW